MLFLFRETTFSGVETVDDAIFPEFRKMAVDCAKEWSEDREKAYESLRIATGAWEKILSQEYLGSDPINFEGVWSARLEILRGALEWWAANDGFDYDTSVFDQLMEELRQDLSERELGPPQDPFFLYVLDPIHAENARLKRWIDGTDTPHLGLRIKNEEARIVQRDGERFRGKSATLTPTTFDFFKKLFSYGDSGLTKEQAENFAGCSGAPLRKTVQRIRESLRVLDVTVEDYRLIERDTES